jgi:bisphosphoglycerate-independent phosphoglycerate mutase (AlkP superfamily)
LTYIAYGETDDFAHNGDYESYLKSTKNTDALIEDLWNYTQQSSHYRGKTTFIISTDHGRGTVPIDSWRSHGKKINGSDQTWIIVFGKGVKTLGEVASEGQLFTHQLAPTVRLLFDLPQKQEKGFGLPMLLNE